MMDRNAILALEGRELDAALAEAFGWEWWGSPETGTSALYPPETVRMLEETHAIKNQRIGVAYLSQVPAYSSTREGMGLIVEAMDGNRAVTVKNSAGQESLFNFNSVDAALTDFRRCWEVLGVQVIREEDSPTHVARLSGSVLRDLRERLGVARTDESKDDEINAMTPMQVVREYCAWQLGDGSWATDFINVWERLNGREEED